MADLEPNDTFQDRGLVKITDGKQILELDAKGNVVESTLSDISATKGGQKYIFVTDTSGVFKEMLQQLKINNAHLSILTGEHLTEDEIGEDVT